MPGAIVLGAGPVGQAVIAALRMRRVAPIIAADLSETRRNLAVAMGAHEAVDPRIDPPFDAWDRHGREDPPVVFDAVGAPGVLNEAIRTAPRRTRLVIVGTCVGGDTITPYWALAKELDIRFSMATPPSSRRSEAGERSTGLRRNYVSAATRSCRH